MQCKGDDSFMSESITGIFKSSRRGGFLRSSERNWAGSSRDPSVPEEFVRQFRLVDGAKIVGSVSSGKQGQVLDAIETVCGLLPGEFAKRPRFDTLTAIDPEERFDLGASGLMPMRVVDLVAPIGKGTRGLIVSPPKAGKTVLLEQIATSIRGGNPNAAILVLLIDERPEEVTHFRRSVSAEVIASSSDQSVADHVELAELVLSHARVELECGRDLVILLDSLTRMGRAFNLKGSGNGRIMSGGVEAGSLAIPRRFFGMARRIEGGGSVTIIATCLIDTGSRMDQLIFEEFKGTGNSELILDRSMAEMRLFPAIDLAQSGTRKEAKLYGEADSRRLSKLRRILADRNPRDAMKQLLPLLEKYPDNRKFLDTIPST